MDSSDDQIRKLEQKLDYILKRQVDFTKEINNIKEEINLIRKIESLSSSQTEESTSKVSTEKGIYNPAGVRSLQENSNPEQKQKATEPAISLKEQARPKDLIKHQSKTSLEKFIGENLMNKIGIAILVIGIAIGTKYSIEHNLISPLTRIILGYVSGIALLVVGMKLRSKYENYSAVLVSGAMTTMYFITFSAYSFFGLIPQVLTFGLMVVFTVFTVIAALSYSRQVIALIGLVGAYAIPFLLSDDSGNVLTLFTYIAIINVGILFISLKKYWKPLYYVSFGLSWLMFFMWYLPEYKFEPYFALALTFASIFFISFYITFLAYKLQKNEVFKRPDIILLLANSFIFYGIGYSLLDKQIGYEQLLGLFTLCNAIVHFTVGLIIHQQKLADKNLYNLVTGLVLVFVVIAIPVQLDGNWVTLLWAGLGALLYWIGKTKEVSLYELLSYPLMLLAFFSLLHDWMFNYNVPYSGVDKSLVSIFNINFLSSSLVIAAFAFIQYVQHKNQSHLLEYPRISQRFTYVIPGMLLFVTYYAFKMEISYYWNHLLVDTRISVKPEGKDYYNFISNYDLNRFKTIWLYNYSMLFAAILSLINLKKIKSISLAYVTLGASVLIIGLFITNGIYTLGELRDSYVLQSQSEYFHRGFFNVAMRYVCVAFVATLMYFAYLNLHINNLLNKYRLYFDLLLHITIITMLSNELVTWLSVNGFESVYKTTLSILFGVYSLAIIILGMVQKRQHLRIGGMSLFAVTLLKLFFYDLTNLSTIQKTIVFVSLGVLLLVISFLYNKYKPVVNEE
ncbi:DUF2339 domain-containing protein [Saccharicrinis sp. 156]|uniref:DUF2339 domain-containing protein n=1 Tax=Saccharicrinis sp. 156 TaxID=3417574 RepID=UPI003D32A9FC